MIINAPRAIFALCERIAICTYRARTLKNTLILCYG